MNTYRINQAKTLQYDIELVLNGEDKDRRDRLASIYERMLGAEEPKLFVRQRRYSWSNNFVFSGEVNIFEGT